MKNKQLTIKNTARVFLAAALSTGPAALHADVTSYATQTVRAAAVAPMTNRIVVKYRDDDSGIVTASAAADRTQLLSLATDTRMRYIRFTGNRAQVLKLDKAQSVEEVQAIADQIAAEPDVLYAEPDLIMQPQAIPLDPGYFQQWHYFELDGGVNLPDAWDVTTGADVVVAVIDTGITVHEDLAGQILPGYDFITSVPRANDGDGRDADATDPGDWTNAGLCGMNFPEQNISSSWHGTHVAGIIAAASNNSQGVAGVAWDAKILPVRVLGRCGGYDADIADAMRWAAGVNAKDLPTNPNPAKVLNLSLGIPSATCPDTIQIAIQEVRKAGAAVVVAAGNEGQHASLHAPANCDGVITVAATNREGGWAFYSNFGGIVDVSAPGGEIFDRDFEIVTPEDGILSSLNSGIMIAEQHTYGFVEGTSAAAPHVTGVAALMYGLNPELTPDQVEALITGTARAFPEALRQCNTQDCGAGIVDASAVVNAVVNGQIP